MKIPLMNLKPALEESKPEYSELLARMFGRMQFILGEQVAAFEKQFAAAMGAHFAIGVGTGTAALELCLREAGITQRSSEVITTPLTAPFTAVAILAAGATPRFADIDPETLLLDAGSAGNRAGRRTRAILPVHLYGQPCDLDRFAALAKTLRAELIQDACQAHGARYRDKALSLYSPYVAYSFYPTKNLGCLGDGGAVTTNHARVAEHIRRLRDGGRGKLHVSMEAGINSRLDEMQACYLSAFLTRLNQWNSRRAQIAAWYDEMLRDCPGVTPVHRSPWSVNHLYVIRAERRASLSRSLAAAGIGSGAHYPVPLHLQPAFAACGARRGDLPHAERACKEVLSLPLWPDLTREQAERVAAAVRAFYRA